jgi:lipid-binding SYLF domain-containing protein
MMTIESLIPQQRVIRLMLAFAIAVLLAVFTLPEANAASARELNTSVDVALDNLVREIPGSQNLLSQAKGVLVFPRVYKAGIGFGGEYGEGALRIGGTTVDFYNIASASFGFQLGAQKKTIVLLFMDDNSLNSFRNSQGWRAGVDASVALIKVGAGGEVDTSTVKAPVVGFVIGQKGLMYNLTLEGSKISKINKRN